MAVQGVGNNPYAYPTGDKTQDAKAANAANNSAAVADPVDTFEKSETSKVVTYKPDRSKINELYSKDKAYVNNLQMLVRGLLNQTGKQQQADGLTAWYAGGAGQAGSLDPNSVDSYWDLLVDNGDGSFSFHPDLSVEAQDALIAKAKEDVGEDGYYGVKQTSGRILDFAKAAAGGDPSKIAEMRKMAEEAFASVREIMGGKLPEISQKTYDAVMAGFDAWEAEVAAGAK